MMLINFFFSLGEYRCWWVTTLTYRHKHKYIYIYIFIHISKFAITQWLTLTVYRITWRRHLGFCNSAHLHSQKATSISPLFGGENVRGFYGARRFLDLVNCRLSKPFSAINNYFFYLCAVYRYFLFAFFFLSIEESLHRFWPWNEFASNRLES